MKWVKASERMPVALKDRQRINIKYKGVADSIINISGRWYWNNDVPTEYLISQDSLIAIEWLDESTPPVSAMEDGWVKVETPPKTGKRVLCLCDTGLMRVGYFYKNGWEQDGPYSSFEQDGYTITHWRPLPPPPSNR